MMDGGDSSAVSIASALSIQDRATQTETVFGLEDLPIVKEIVRKTIAKTKKNDADQYMRQPDISNRPVNGIYTCPLCAKVCIV